MNRRARLVAATALAATAAPLLFTSTAHALSLDGFETYFECDGLGTAFAEVSIVGVDGETYSMLFDGETIGSSFGPGNVTFEFAELEDGAYLMELKDNSSGDVFASEEIPVMCNGPVVAAVTECDLDDGVLGVWVDFTIFDTDESTFDVYVNGAQVRDDILGDPDGAGFGNGIYEPGEELLVEVYWNEADTDEPWYSALLSDDCGLDLTSDNGSGAGLPGTGSDTTPLVLVAGSLLAIGAALLGIRRAHMA